MLRFSYWNWFVVLISSIIFILEQELRYQTVNSTLHTSLKWKIHTYYQIKLANMILVGWKRLNSMSKQNHLRSKSQPREGCEGEPHTETATWSVNPKRGFRRRDHQKRQNGTAADALLLEASNPTAAVSGLELDFSVCCIWSSLIVTFLACLLLHFNLACGWLWSLLLVTILACLLNLELTCCYISSLLVEFGARFCYVRACFWWSLELSCCYNSSFLVAFGARLLYHSSLLVEFGARSLLHSALACGCTWSSLGFELLVGGVVVRWP